MVHGFRPRARQLHAYLPHNRESAYLDFPAESCSTGLLSRAGRSYCIVRGPGLGVLRTRLYIRTVVDVGGVAGSCQLATSTAGIYVVISYTIANTHFKYRSARNLDLIKHQLPLYGVRVRCA